MCSRIVPFLATLAIICSAGAQTPPPAFGPSNPFFAPSTLPFRAPPFDRIKDSDYQPALEAGIAEQMKEIDAIANNPAPPDFANTLVALEKSGQLLIRVRQAFGAMTSANTNPDLQKIQTAEAPKLSALADAVMLNPKLFARVKAVYENRNALSLDPESKRLVELTYTRFTHAGANLADADKAQLKQINQQLSVLSNAFRQKLLAAAKAGAYATTDKEPEAPHFHLERSISHLQRLVDGLLVLRMISIVLPVPSAHGVSRHPVAHRSQHFVNRKSSGFSQDVPHRDVHH
jgi:peptidyl-dipeptidase Dcp